MSSWKVSNFQHSMNSQWIRNLQSLSEKRTIIQLDSTGFAVKTNWQLNQGLPWDHIHYSDISWIFLNYFQSCTWNKTENSCPFYLPIYKVFLYIIVLQGTDVTNIIALIWLHTGYLHKCIDSFCCYAHTYIYYVSR